MTIEEQLKNEILYKFKSVREFALSANIPYSTVDSVLKRGIKKSGVGTVIKIFSFLDLDMESISSGRLEKKIPSMAEVIPGGEFPDYKMRTRFEHSLGTFSAGKSALINSLVPDPKLRVATAMDKLNEAGQEKAAERVEELTEVPKYQRQSVPNGDV